MAYLLFLLAVVSLKVGALEACVKYEENIIERVGHKNQVEVKYESLDKTSELLSLRVTYLKNRCYACFVKPLPSKHSQPKLFKFLRDCKVNKPAKARIIKNSDLPVSHLYNICEEAIPELAVVRLKKICDALRLRQKTKGI